MSETRPKEFFESDEQRSEDNVTQHSSSSSSSSKMPNIQSRKGHSVVIGQLPDDFLRVDGSNDSSSNSNPPTSNDGGGHISPDEELAAALQQQYYNQSQSMYVGQWDPGFQALLTIKLVEAHLVKNYGIFNMSVYGRIRVGESIIETQTNKGGKNPKWNDSYRCYLPKGVSHISIELYDHGFTQDELIAWASYKIPEKYLVFTGETPEHIFEDKIILSGKQGDGKEGELFFVINTKPITPETIRAQITTAPKRPQGIPYVVPPILAAPLVVHQAPIPASTLLPPNSNANANIQTPEPPPPELREEDIKTLLEMFPKIEIEIIKSILLNERGNMERAITNLLELNSST